MEFAQYKNKIPPTGNGIYKKPFHGSKIRNHIRNLTDFNKFLNNTSLKGSETDSIIRIKYKIPIEEPKKELKTTQIGLNTNYPVGEIKRHKEKPLLKEMLLIKNKNFYSSMGNTLVVW